MPAIRAVTIDNQGAARVWNTSTGECIKVFADTHALKCTVCSTGETLAFVVDSRVLNIIQVWNIATGERIHDRSVQTPGRIANLEIAADGSLALTTSKYPGRNAHISNLRTGVCMHILSGHSADVVLAHFSSGGSLAITASDDLSAKIWIVSTGVCMQTLSLPDHCLEAVFSADAALVFTTFMCGTAKIWSVSAGLCVQTFSGHSDAEIADFSADGSLALTSSGDMTAKIWNVSAGTCVQTLSGHSARVQAAQFSPIQSLLVTASQDMTARIWDVSTAECLCLHILIGHTEGIERASFCVDGTMVITSSGDKTSKIWNTITGACMHTFTGEAGAFIDE